MAALPTAFAVLAAAVLIATLFVALKMPAYAQEERDHRDLNLGDVHTLVVRSASVCPANDNTGAFTVHECTMVGFAACLLVSLVIGTLIVCGVIA